MARGKGSTSPQALSHREATELFKRVDVHSLSHFIQRVLPESDPKFTAAQTLRMHCLLPGHPDVHPSFAIDMRRGIAQCRPCQYRTRNLLQLFQDSRLAWGYGQTLRELQATTGTRLVPERLEAQYEALDQHRDAVRLIAWVTNTYLVNMINPPEGDPAYNALARSTADLTLNWLFEVREHKRELVAGMPYGLWPPHATMLEMAEARLLELSSADYINATKSRFPPARRKKILAKVKELAEVAGPEWNHAVAYVTGHDLSTPARIRLRRPDVDQQKDGNILIFPGYTPDEPNGFYGLYSPRSEGAPRENPEDLKLLVVEGENDQTTIAEHLILEAVPGWLVVATCGLANKTDSLQQAGFDTAYFLHDHPSPTRGRGEVWLRDRLLNSAHLQAYVFNYWEQLSAQNSYVKDPDDVIRQLGFDHFRATVLDGGTRAFVPCEDWAYQRAVVDAQEAEGSIERTAIAAKFGECVGHPAQLASYLDRVAETLGVAPAVIRAQILKGQDDEPGFLRRLIDTLAHEIYFLYKEDTAKGPRVFAYHRESRRPMTFLADSGNDIAIAIANVSGDIYTYFKERVGMPSWLFDDKVEKTAPVIRELQRHLTDYLKIAVQSLFLGLPTKRECEMLNRGPHVRPDGLGGFIQYINTGKCVYKGVQALDGTLIWSVLPGPADGRRVFDVLLDAPQGMIESIEDLRWGNTVTLTQIRDAVAEIATVVFPCWRFKHQDSDAILLSMLLAYLCVPHFSEDKVNVLFHGLTNSGKSTAMGTFCGGQYPHLQLVDQIMYMSDYTAAGVARKCDRCTQTLAMDEFTQDGEHVQKSKQVANISEMTRQAPFPGGARIARATVGGVTGETVEYHLHMNILTTSIHLPKDVQDVNRRLDFETVRERGRLDPAHALFTKMSRERFLEIRRILNLGLYKFYAHYQTHFEKVVEELTKQDFFPHVVDSRFTRNFYAAGAMCSMLGGDWRGMVRTSTKARLPMLNLIAESSANNVLFEVLLRTNALRIGNAYTSVLALLAEGDKTPLLNGTSHGVYYNESRGYLVVDWIAVASAGGILHRVDLFSREPAFRLKHQLDQHASALAWEEYEKYKVEDFMLSCGNPIAVNLVSVLLIGPIVNTFRQKNLRRTSLGEKPQSNLAATAEAAGSAPGGSRDEIPPGMRKPVRNM